MHVYLVCVCVARHSSDIEKCIKREEPCWPFYVRERSKGGDVRCRATVCKSNSALFLDLTQRNLLSYSLGSSHFSVPLWTTKRATCDAARRVASTSSVKNMRKIIYVTATESRIQTTIRRVARSRASSSPNDKRIPNFPHRVPLRRKIPCTFAFEIRAIQSDQQTKKPPYRAIR